MEQTIMWFVMKDQKRMEDIIQGYEDLLESLRTRLSILNTSVFLLEETLETDREKRNEYINRINRELERIRDLIIYVPETLRGN
jgi:Ni,Fe-hydrogenase III large subunit